MQLALLVTLVLFEFWNLRKTCLLCEPTSSDGTVCIAMAGSEPLGPTHFCMFLLAQAHHDLVMGVVPW